MALSDAYLFGYLCQRATEHDGWILIAEDVMEEQKMLRVSVSFKPLQSATCLVAFRTEIETPDDHGMFEVDAFPIPESYIGSGPFGTSLQLYKTLAPGDIILEVSDITLAMAGLRDMVVLLLGDRKSSSRRDNEQDLYYVRYLHRRNYPDTGSLCCLQVPYDAAAETCMLQIGSSLCNISVIQQSRCNKRISVMNGVVCPCEPPIWAAQQLLQCAQQNASLQRMHLTAMPSESMKSAGEDFYIILSLKACQHGFPLIPATQDQLENDVPSVFLDGGWWTQPTLQHPTFSSILQLFLSSIGLADVQLFSTLLGKELVPWQVAVARKTWESVLSEFEPAWKKAGSAYRKLFKTKAVPHIAQNGKPRWKEPRCEDMWSKMGSLSGSSDINAAYRVRNTFIDFDGSDATHSDADSTLTA